MNDPFGFPPPNEIQPCPSCIQDTTDPDDDGLCPDCATVTNPSKELS